MAHAIRWSMAPVGRWLRSVRPERQHLRADLIAGLPGAISSVPDGMAAAQQWLVRTWDTVLAAYAAEVSRHSQRQAPTRPHQAPADQHQAPADQPGSAP